MATGNFGNIRPSDAAIEDMEAFYTYSPDRITLPSAPLRLNVTEVLEQINHPEDTNRIMGGLYTLKLPSTIFSEKGIYTISIRPKEIKLRILDCGILSAKPDIKGLIFDLQNISPADVSKFENNGLIGYRIEYLNPNSNVSEKKIRNLFRIITSNFKVEPITDNLNNTTQKSIKYRINENSTLVFCTVSPSTAYSLKPNSFPFIGNPNQEVILTNTFFNPTTLEIELVEHDFDTLAIGIFGNQAKDLKTGVHTYYNPDNEIYKQFNEYVIKDNFTNEDLFEVKENKEDIDFTQEFDRIKAQ